MACDFWGVSVRESGAEDGPVMHGTHVPLHSTRTLISGELGYLAHASAHVRGSDVCLVIGS